MGNTSIKAVNKYNKKTYKTFSARIKPELFDEVINFCKEQKLSYPQFVKLALEKLKEDKLETE